MNMLAQYQALIAERFPNVVLHEDTEGPSCGGCEDLDAFCVPDDSASSFMAFLLDELPILSEAMGLPPVGIIPHSLSATREYYPRMCAHLDVPNHTHEASQTVWITMPVGCWVVTPEVREEWCAASTMALAEAA